MRPGSPSHQIGVIPPPPYVCLQAVNKLEEIMNRTEFRGGGSRRGNGTDMRRKEKENRKLQLELRSEKEKLNSSIIKYQREINEMQAVGGMFTHLVPCSQLVTMSVQTGKEHFCLTNSRIYHLGHHVLQVFLSPVSVCLTRTCFFWCMYSNCLRRARCASSCRWLWTAKTATSSS